MSANCHRSEVRQNDKTESAELPAQGHGGVTQDVEMPAVGTRGAPSDMGSLPRWTSAEYCRECGGMFDVRRFRAMAEDGRHLVNFDRYPHTALGVWQCRWSVLVKWCVRFMTNVRYVHIPFV